jgi:NADPH-dependent 2,4-dienoyl-CoA reductase/sulfur reductase-like enzyme
LSSYKYLIVGGGMTADAAVGGIREVDPVGSIGLISEEPDPPYNRPPLTKGLWKGKRVADIWRGTAEHGVDLTLGRKVVRLDLERSVVEDDSGATTGFECMLLATGGRPRRLPFGGENILYYRTLADFRRLWSAAEEREHFAVIGGGFIGAEIAAALAMNDKQVTMLFPEPSIGARVFPPDTGRFLVDYYRNRGVDVRAEETVTAVDAHDGQVRVSTASGRVMADRVVAGIGIVPNSDLAEAAGLEVDDGIVVDEMLRTSRDGVYAAGDVASFFSPALGKRVRYEHEDNALTMGRQAGRNMAGAREPYHHLPSFYSDLFDLGYEAVGDVDARLEVLEDWAEPYQKGVLYYYDEGVVRGVLLWNVWDRVDAARQLIAEQRPVAAGSIPTG